MVALLLAMVTLFSVLPAVYAAESSQQTNEESTVETMEAETVEESASTYATGRLTKEPIRQILTTSREAEDISYTDQVGYVSAWVTAQ